MSLLAIDPGNEHSAFVLYGYDMLRGRGRVEDFGYLPNDELLGRVRAIAGSREPRGMATHDVHHLAIEMIASYGMAVGREVFDTCVWIGRFIEAWDGPHTRVYRQAVKLHLCKVANAKDANIRAALIDKFGPGKQKAVGTKAKPGPLYGVSGDVWAALAVAVTHAEGGTPA